MGVSSCNHTWGAYIIVYIPAWNTIAHAVQKDNKYLEMSQLIIILTAIYDKEFKCTCIGVYMYTTILCTSLDIPGSNH